MYKKKLLLIIGIVVLIIIVIIILVNFKKNNKNIRPDIEVIPTQELISQQNQKSQNQIVNSNIVEITNQLSKLFSGIGRDLGKLEFIVDEYEIYADFSSIRHIEFYAMDELSESINFYDKNGYKIDLSRGTYQTDNMEANETLKVVYGLPVLNVEISNDIYNSQIGNYYLLRYYDEDSPYTYYFISQLTTAGFKQFDLYVISSGESYYNEFIDEKPPELEEDINY